MSQDYKFHRTMKTLELPSSQKKPLNKEQYDNLTNYLRLPNREPTYDYSYLNDGKLVRPIYKKTY